MDENDGLRVLIIDDDQQQLAMLERLLRSEGFTVETSSSPIGVSNQVRRFGPNVVLIDVNIPALSGDKLVSVIRRNAESEMMRLVLFSAADEDELRRRAREVGADGWLKKSFDATRLARDLRHAWEQPSRLST
jgi:DNA-binding response OmpR family regulator